MTDDRAPATMRRGFAQARSSAREARRWIADEVAAQDVAVDKRADIVLCVSELVTNAVDHAASAPVVVVTITADHVRLEVIDESAELPEVLPADATRVGGNGCRLVRSLAQGWGVRFDDRGSKVVWCTIDTSA